MINRFSTTRKIAFFVILASIASLSVLNSGSFKQRHTSSKIHQPYTNNDSTIFELIDEPIPVRKFLDFYNSSASTNTNKSFDEYCDQQAEWSVIGNNIFIKRAALFYFSDAKLLRINVLKRANFNYSFDLRIELRQHGGQSIAQFNVAKSLIYDKFIASCSKYNLTMIDAIVDITAYTNLTENLEMFVKVTELLTGNTTNSFLAVNIKNLDAGSSHKLKKGSLLCTKCLFLSKSDGLLPLKWWLEVNKRSGYDKIQICDHSIERDPDFQALFESYSTDFLKVTRLHCIPNLQGISKHKNRRYIDYKALEYGDTGKFDVTKMDVVSQLVVNECYLKNIDKYKFVSVIDVDEVIIAARTPGRTLTLTDQFTFVSNAIESDLDKKEFDSSRFDQLKCDRYDLSNIVEDKSTFESYLNELVLNVAQEIKQPTSFFFNQGYFLANSLVNDLFAEFNTSLNNQTVVEQIKSGEYNFSLTVVDKNNRKGQHAFAFTIRSKREFDYAVSLFKVYSNYLRPFLEQNKIKISKHMQDFDRLFQIVGYLNSFALGKTVHSTRVTFDLSLHFYDHIMNLSSDSRPVIFDDFHHNKKYTYVPYELAHMAHFRKQQYFEYKTVPFASFYFDFNYFNCYFKPILEYFDKQV